MSTMTWRGTLAWSIVLSAGWVGIEYALYDVTDPVELVGAAAFFFAVVFFSMLASTRAR